jgi:hypothetical protein
MNLKTIFVVGALLFLNFTGIGCAQSTTSHDNLDENAKLTSIYPLLWESRQDDGRAWSSYVLKVIHEDASELIQGADDMDEFCPRYDHLSTNERANVWAFLISAMVKFESGHDPLSRMLESTLGKDSVTGKPVYSEGLLQLSYQDTKYYPFCDFDWSRDKRLDPKDPRKTILNPYKNLYCGVRILAQQIKNRHRITLPRNVYWAVLKIDGSHSKIPQIAALTKSVPGCTKGP